MSNKPKPVAAIANENYLCASKNMTEYNTEKNYLKLALNKRFNLII